MGRKKVKKKTLKRNSNFVEVADEFIKIHGLQIGSRKSF